MGTLLFVAVCFAGLVCCEIMFWLTCRVSAKRCPACGSKWQTELRGEWDGEMWTCHACSHNWECK